MRKRGKLASALLGAAVLSAAGCTTLREWWQNGLKVGPNHQQPMAAVAPQWLQSDDPRVQSGTPVPCAWWTAFDDPKLDWLIDKAYRENLDLQQAAYRIVEARANRNMVAGQLFPQRQEFVGAFAHGQISDNVTQGAFPNLFNLWFDGFAVTWEFDLWGKIRRAREAADATLDASVDSYNDVLVLLLADVATNYIQVRTFQQELQNARQNMVIQRKALELAESRHKSGRTSEVDVQQAISTLARTEAAIPPLEAGLRQANNRLCILLGTPPHDLLADLEVRPIPSAPADIAVGVPADLLRRRPDVRRSEREVAAQCAQIGVAEADFYPSFGLAGFLGYSGNQFPDLFKDASFTGIIAPNIQWKILNYGRIKNHVMIEEARLKERVLDYQQTVLRAGREAEDAITAALAAQEQIRHLTVSMKAAERSATLALARYEEGKTDFTPVFTAQEAQVRAQDQLAEAQQGLALNLVRTYKALGGGWEAFQGHCNIQNCKPEVPTVPAELPPPVTSTDSVKDTAPLCGPTSPYRAVKPPRAGN